MENITILELEEFDNIAIQGDLHSDYNSIPHFLNSNELDRVLIINVGDFAMFGHKPELDELNRNLGLRESKLLVVRGNHDNPMFYTGESIYENITFLKDYTLVKVNDKNILCVGGAISIDRKCGTLSKPNAKDRIGFDYFLDEGFVLKEVDVDRIDLVITHTAPDGVFPFYQGQLVDNYALVDETLKTDLFVERYQVRLFCDAILPKGVKQWYYGHFHQDSVTYIGETRFQCLSPQQFKVLNLY